MSLVYIFFFFLFPFAVVECSHRFFFFADTKYDGTAPSIKRALSDFPSMIYILNQSQASPCLSNCVLIKILSRTRHLLSITLQPFSMPIWHSWNGDFASTTRQNVHKSARFRQKIYLPQSMIAKYRNYHQQQITIAMSIRLLSIRISDSETNRQKKMGKIQ